MDINNKVFSLCEFNPTHSPNNTIGGNVISSHLSFVTHFQNTYVDYIRKHWNTYGTIIQK